MFDEKFVVHCNEVELCRLVEYSVFLVRIIGDPNKHEKHTLRKD